MAQPASIYEQLTGVKISDATVSQLDFTKNTFIDSNSIGWWKGPITISKVMEASRTYAGGTLPIPETGAIEVIALGAGESKTFKPTGTEIWNIKGMFGVATGGAATVTLAVTDGTTVMPFRFGMSIPTAGVVIGMENLGAYGRLTVTNSLWWVLTETGGANSAAIQIAYFKASL